MGAPITGSCIFDLSSLTVVIIISLFQTSYNAAHVARNRYRQYFAKHKPPGHIEQKRHQGAT
ncbi:MAG: hypothetical protein DHS20C04_29540 [Hyphococcus sp.]|nr:MAG: hypothetical protein DHS20C04_29540 [Marinicaulis sp.]